MPMLEPMTDAVAQDVVAGADGRIDALRDGTDIAWAIDVGQGNGELVAADAGGKVTVAEHLGDALSHALQ